jgi:uncharacterized protein YfaS (alpha-2-macroglobulin family)
MPAFHAEAAPRNPASRAARGKSASVASFAPVGKAADNPAFRVEFSDAIVAQEALDKPLELKDFPFTVTPAIRAEGKWVDQRTFTATLLAPLDMATVYTASVREGLKALDGKNVAPASYGFQTDPPKLLSARAVVLPDRNQAEINLEFNISIPHSRLRNFLSVQLQQRNRGRSGVSSYEITGTSKAPRVYVSVGSLPTTLTVRLAAGLTGDVGTLGLEKDVEHSFELKPVLTVNSIYASDYRPGSITVYTNRTVDLDEAKGFIDIEPDIPFSLENYYNGAFYIQADFKPRSRYTFTFRKGLPSTEDDVVLAEDTFQAVIIPDLNPSISFPSSGTFLSSTGGGRIPVELTNIRKLQVDLWRLYENNLPYAVRGAAFDISLARRVYSSEYQLSLPLNEKTRRSIAIEELMSGDAGVPRGLFLLSLRSPDTEYWDEQRRIVNLSDMGIAARLWEDGILVWVNTLSGPTPISEAHVRLYSGANQLLAEGKTDENGVWEIQCDSLWSRNSDMTPDLVTVTRGEEAAFVKLNRGLMSREAFDTSGRPWLRDGYDAALFSARDIYRTGEQAFFKAVVRNHDLTAPEPFPVLFDIQDPLSRTVKRGTAILSAEGGALFDFDIPSNALTGQWQVRLSIPSRNLASYSFSVEDFAPPRVEAKLTTEANLLLPGEDTGFALSGRYFFGADGAGLNWQARWRAREGQFQPKADRWAPYAFSDATRSFSPRGEDIGDGTLDEEGWTGFVFETPDWDAPVLDVTVTALVQEDGGRWVADTMTLPYYPVPWVLGLTQPEGMLAVRNDVTFRAAAVTPSEEPADPGELTASLYRVSWHYNLVEVDGYTRWQSSEEFQKIESKPVVLENGTGSFTFQPKRWGTYVVKLTDEKGKASASVRFWADDPEYAEQGSQILDRVEIVLDKDTYKVGDVAKVTLRAPFEGLMLFGAEAMGAIDRRILKVDKAETVVEVPITEKMVPNAWCSAWLIRPVAEEETWGAHRALGVKAINADVSGSSLSVKLDAPEKAEPASRLSVTLTLTDAQNKPARGEVALALVDDAVLGLTNFEAPDLLKHFLARRKLNSNSYDLYDLLVPLESRATELLHPSGGGLMEAMAGAPKGQRFKILSLFEGMLTADEKGVIKAELELPEFSGRGRLFAVAASGARFGVAEQRVQIAREIVTEAELPRFAAPGDVFTVPVTVFNSGAESRDVTVELLTSSGLAVERNASIEQSASFSASVSASGFHGWDVRLRALDPGTAVYTVKTLWKEGQEEKSYTQVIELPIRSPFPTVTLSGSGIFSSGDAKIDIPWSAFTGDARGGLTLSDTPAVDLTKAMRFLVHYPYGCLEQTLSSAWPFIVLPDALAEIDPLLVNSAAVRRKTDFAIARLQAMQLYDGSFSKWPGDGHPYIWGSVHAAHFLVEARKAGVDYPQEMLQSSINWLKQFLASTPSTKNRYGERNDFTTKAYAVYVLALNGEKPLGWMHYLRENEDLMWPSGRIWLAAAYSLAEGRADALRALGAWGGGEILEPEALYETLESNVRNTAQLLSIWAEVEPRSPETMRLAQMLLDWGKKNRWYSTQENAAVAMALGRYLIRTGYEKGQLEGVLTTANGQALGSFRSGERTPLTLEDPALGGTLSLRMKGTGSGYYAWTLTGSPSSAPEPVSMGLSVEQSLWVGNTVLVPGRPVAQGDRILVRLTLNPSVNIGDAAVSYLLPAGMELDNPRLKGGDDSQETRGVRLDVRDDRLLLFIDQLNQKTDYEFTMRAVTRGTFVVPPVAAEGMYDPGVRFVAKEQPNIVVE